jgi:hypothetical protein
MLVNQVTMLAGTSVCRLSSLFLVRAPNWSFPTYRLNCNLLAFRASNASSSTFKAMASSSIRPLVICGPSGVGKSTIVNKLLEEFPNVFGFSVSHTTRKPRGGEQVKWRTPCKPRILRLENSSMIWILGWGKLPLCWSRGDAQCYS